jgi:hypothetical protein
MVEVRNAYNISIGKPDGKDHKEDLGVDGNTLKWILRKSGGLLWTGCIWLAMTISDVNERWVS